MNFFFNFILLSFIFLGSKIYSQVGINNNNPNVTLEVTAKNTNGSTSEEIIAPRITGDALHQADINNKYGTSQDGTIVYVLSAPSSGNATGQTVDVNAKGYYYYDSTQNKWMKFRCGCDTVLGTVSTFNCSSGTVSGSLISGLPSTGVTVSIPYTGGNGGTYSAQTVSSTGVTGLTASLPAGTLANGSGNVTYTISGTPSGSGSAIFAVSLGGQTCNLSINVQGALTKGSGSLAGKTCFDVVMVNNGSDCGLLTGRQSQKADFSQTSTNTQTYTFTPTSAVSNVRFYYVNTNGNVITAISGGNAGTNITGAVNATVNYNTALNALASNTTRANALTANIIVVYNNNATNTGTDVQLTLTVNVQDCVCCGAYIAPGVWKNFMCQNLGADMTADPFTISPQIYGARYFWGIATPYLTQAQDATYNGTDSSGNASWTNWSDTVKTINDPCPVGYRVPTSAQWTNVINNNNISYYGTWNNNNFSNFSAYAMMGSSLLLPANGQRISGTTATIQSQGGLFRGSLMGYWASTAVNSSLVNAMLGFYNNIPSGGEFGRQINIASLGIRCIAE